MFTIHHQVGIRAEPIKVYKALTTGIRGWWTKQVDGSPQKEGSLFGLGFTNTKMEMKVDKLEPCQLVRWQCLESHRLWQDTFITFSLSNDSEHNQTLVDFQHSDWQEDSSLFCHCSTKWAVFLLSLKDLLEKGQGHPHPNDILINHNE